MWKLGWGACGGVRCRVHRCGCQLRYYLPTGFRQVIKASQAFLFNAVQCKVLHQHETRLLILCRRTWELGLHPTCWKVFREKRSTVCCCFTPNNTIAPTEASGVRIVFVPGIPEFLFSSESSAPSQGCILRCGVSPRRSSWKSNVVQSSQGRSQMRINVSN